MKYTYDATLEIFIITLFTLRIIYIYIYTHTQKKPFPSKHHMFNVTSLGSRIPLLQTKNVIKYIMEYNIILFIAKPILLPVNFISPVLHCLEYLL